MIDQDRIIKVNIDEEMKSSYIDYSMSVIVSRALPDVRDGFKPVHRRVLFGMNELGNNSDKPYKKSARIVGEVMGKYHPHGDSSIYGTLVRMASIGQCDIHWSTDRVTLVRSMATALLLCVTPRLVFANYPKICLAISIKILLIFS